MSRTLRPTCTRLSQWTRVTRATFSTSVPRRQESAAEEAPTSPPKPRVIINNRNGPSLQDFLIQGRAGKVPVDAHPDIVPYLQNPMLPNALATGARKTYHVEVYGCQMNYNDTEILMAVLEKAGYTRVDRVKDANVIFLMTCAIRDNAEKKIWNRLEYLRLKMRLPDGSTPLIGVLGCMAERLKERLFDSHLVDIVCGPDAYRSLPNLIGIAEQGADVANVMLSADETYADIHPLRVDNAISAHLSIMRGCNNMCSFCIVPFTRGNERSRPVDSIVQEVQRLQDQGVKEVMLLGQNVNSYRDESESVHFSPGSALNAASLSNEGFKTIYRRKEGGRRFADLLDQVSIAAPRIRFGFTSPHPKDFPVELLQLIAERDNLCKNVHLPAQSGNTEMLRRMRRGYSREAYLALVETIRGTIPDVAITSDFITGFCGETDAEHADTVSLMEAVRFDMAFMYAYSMREKTHAHRRMVDDVPEEVKKARLAEIIETFHVGAKANNDARIGNTYRVLVSGTSKRSATEVRGTTDGGLKVIFPDTVAGLGQATPFKAGDWVSVTVTGATSSTLLATPNGSSHL